MGGKEEGEAYRFLSVWRTLLLTRPSSYRMIFEGVSLKDVLIYGIKKRRDNRKYAYREEVEKCDPSIHSSTLSGRVQKGGK